MPGRHAYREHRLAGGPQILLVERRPQIRNLFQRHAAVVAQMSVREGFGLTVSEAMWKGRPVVGSAVGGIQDQIRDGVDGLLVGDPHDLEAFADAVRTLLGDNERAQIRTGQASFLEPVHDRADFFLEIEDHFRRNFDVSGVTTACEYLADQGLIGKASTPVRLTKKSNVEVQELAFFYTGEPGHGE